MKTVIFNTPETRARPRHRGPGGDHTGLSATSRTRHGHQPSVLVLCDDDLLHRIIALSLRDCALEAAPLHACRVLHRTGGAEPALSGRANVSPPSPEDGDCDVTMDAAPDPASGRYDPASGRYDPASGRYDLIVLALGASRTEPLVALNRAALLDCVGVTPLLVVSRRAFEGDPGAGIYHMPFPFDAHDLNRQVKRLAGG